MKKLLVLLCVFALATVANATILELSINGVTNGAGTTADTTLTVSDEITIDVYCSASTGLDSFWLGIEGQDPDTGEWYRSTATLYDAAPGDFQVSDGGYGDGWFKTWQDPPNPGDPGAVGTWFDVTFHCLGEGELLINLYNNLGTVVVDTIAVTQIPEPMTIALLGLGGLFLRRRR